MGFLSIYFSKASVLAKRPDLKKVFLSADFPTHIVQLFQSFSDDLINAPLCQSDRLGCLICLGMFPVVMFASKSQIMGLICKL